MANSQAISRPFVGVIARDVSDRFLERLGREVSGKLGADPPGEKGEHRVEI